MKKTKMHRKRPDIDQIVATIAEPEFSELKLKQCSAEKAFFLSDGRILRSILELVSAIDDMPPDVFSHHVNETKNDFASWIREVFDEEQLAERLLGNTSKDRHEIEMLKYLLGEFMEGEK